MPSTRYRLNNLYRKTKSKKEKTLVPITLAQLETDTTSERLLDEICHFIYSEPRAKEITRKV